MKALVLSGGGAKGIFQVGALRYIFTETDWKPDIIAGVSVGALHTAILSKHTHKDLAVEELEHIWFDRIKSKNDIYRDSLWRKIGVAVGLYDGLFDNTPLWNLVCDYLVANTFVNPFFVETVCIENGLTYVFSNDTDIYEALNKDIPPDWKISSSEALRFDNLRKAIFASASIPGLFPSVYINDMRFVDGGVRNVVPLENVFRYLEAFSMEYNEIVIVTCQSRYYAGDGFKHKFVDTMYRTFQTVRHEFEESDILPLELFRPDEYDVRLIAPRKLLFGTLDFEEASDLNGAGGIMHSMGFEMAKLAFEE